MPTPEMLSIAAVAISGLSLVVAIFAVRYTRAAHLKKLADEQPIFWAEVAGGTLGWTLTVRVRNRASADLQCHLIEIAKPAGLLIVAQQDVYRSDREGGFKSSPEMVAAMAQRQSAMTMRTGPAGLEASGQIVRSPGDTSFEMFRLHAEPSLRARISNSKIKVSMRLTWSLKDAASRKRVEHVNITLNAETKPDVAASKIAT